MSLTPDQRRASRELGLIIDGAIAKRLALHGFHGAGFGCVARGVEPPRSISSALSVCIEEAAEPVGLPGDEVLLERVAQRAARKAVALHGDAAKLARLAQEHGGVERLGRLVEGARALRKAVGE